MILFHKNTKINVVDTREISSINNLSTQTFKTNENDNKFYYQGEIKYDEGKPIWHGYGKMWTDYFTFNGEFKNGLLKKGKMYFAKNNKWTNWPEKK